MSKDPNPYHGNLPWQPEPLDQLIARFPAALQPIRLPLTRRHVFDLEEGIRMIVDIEADLGLHLSFGVPPHKATLTTARELIPAMKRLAAIFLGPDAPEPSGLVGTGRALHAFWLSPPS